MAMTFWDLVQAFRDETGASEAWIMRKAQVNKGTFSAWRQRGIPVLPPRRTLVLLSEILKVPYDALLLTILHDTGYLPAAVAVEAEVQLERAALERRRNFDEAAWRRQLEESAEELRLRSEPRADLAFSDEELSEEEKARQLHERLFPQPPPETAEAENGAAEGA